MNRSISKNIFNKCTKVFKNISELKTCLVPLLGLEENPSYIAAIIGLTEAVPEQDLDYNLVLFSL